MEKKKYFLARRRSFETEMSAVTKMLSRQTDTDLKNRDAYLSPSFKVVEPEKKSKKSEVRILSERIWLHETFCEQVLGIEVF